MLLNLSTLALAIIYAGFAAFGLHALVGSPRSLAPWLITLFSLPCLAALITVQVI
jgi:hypothetical protein